MLIFVMKIKFNKNFVMLRGNHESKNMTSHFTFREEVLEKHDSEVYDALMDAFNHLPIAAIADEKYLCMHGGISPSLKKINDINKLNRVIEPPLKGLMCDLLWSDPMPDEMANEEDFLDNHERECSYTFGKKPA